MPRRAASLNSGDMFVLETPYVAFLWRGKVTAIFIIFSITAQNICLHSIGFAEYLFAQQ